LRFAPRPVQVGIGRGLLTESALLNLPGGAIGVACAYSSRGALLAIAPPHLPRVDDIDIDSTVLLFALALTSLTAMLCALVPMLRRGQTRLRSGGATDIARQAHSSRARAATPSLSELKAAVGRLYELPSAPTRDGGQKAGS
jgi:hypothetical protein